MSANVSSLTEYLAANFINDSSVVSYRTKAAAPCNFKSHFGNVKRKPNTL